MREEGNCLSGNLLCRFRHRRFSFDTIEAKVVNKHLTNMKALIYGEKNENFQL